MFSSIEVTCVSGCPRPVYALHPQGHTSCQPLSWAPDFKRDPNRLAFAPVGGGEREGGQDTEGEKILVKRWFQERKQLTQGQGLVWGAPQNPGQGSTGPWGGHEAGLAVSDMPGCPLHLSSLPPSAWWLCLAPSYPVLLAGGRAALSSSSPKLSPTQWQFPNSSPKCPREKS